MARYWIALLIACVFLAGAFTYRAYAAPRNSITVKLPPVSPPEPAPGFHFGSAA